MHHIHGVGHYEGMVKRTIGGVERDYLLVAYKGGDKLYEVKARDAQGRMMEMDVDARTAEVLHSEAD